MALALSLHILAAVIWNGGMFFGYLEEPDNPNDGRSRLIRMLNIDAITPRIVGQR
jgi:hypothetical protein